MRKIGPAPAARPQAFDACVALASPRRGTRKPNRSHREDAAADLKRRRDRSPGGVMRVLLKDHLIVLIPESADERSELDG